MISRFRLIQRDVNKASTLVNYLVSPKRNESTNFGYKKVDVQDKQKEVNKVFDNVAKKYDIMNDLMSAGIHRAWKNSLISEINPNYNMKLIDVAGGTGDIAFRFLNHLTSRNPKQIAKVEDSSNLKVTVCDINENMLRVGQERSKTIELADKIEWKVSNAENLENEPDNTYDVYTIAFGIRNCTHLDKVVKEAHRVLKPGGRFMCLEFSKPTNPLFEKFYDFYSFNVIPVTGYLVAGDWDSYQYLVESIRMFPSQVEFADLISNCGFKYVNYKNYTNGVVALHSGLKL